MEEAHKSTESNREKKKKKIQQSQQNLNDCSADAISAQRFWFYSGE